MARPQGAGRVRPNHCGGRTACAVPLSLYFGSSLFCLSTMSFVSVRRRHAAILRDRLTRMIDEYPAARLSELLPFPQSANG
ncbi:transposase domain-containing protein [Gluconobacter cerinus]|uniref:transposase domain-containing protein n=1 Tax=Gluconobacter cerinus TaxID=38307 RepID=UPI001B8B44BD|nr:transposase domain-containing protein [Gluconobacter cerinus]MBS0983456.1 transposase domain-containing protein [Gluconobacter cerinus]